MKKYALLLKYLLLFSLLLSQYIVQSQVKKDSIKTDSIQIKNFSVKTDTTQEIKTLKSAIRADTIIPFVADKLEKFSMKIHTSNRILKNVFDLAKWDSGIASMNTIIDKTQKRISRPGYIMNLQSANTSLILLGEFQEETENQLDNINKLYSNLTNNNKEIKNIIQDPIFKLQGIPDSNLVRQLDDLQKESKTLDSTEIIHIAHINYMRSKLATLDLRFKDLLSDLNYLQSSRIHSIWKTEEPALYNLKKDSYKQNQGLFKNIQKSLLITIKIIPIYLMNKGYILILGLFLLLSSYWIILSSKKT